MEVMGLMLGEFVDDYTVNDVFAMPQSGTVSVCLYIFLQWWGKSCTYNLEFHKGGGGGGGEPAKSPPPQKKILATIVSMLLYLG